MVRSIAEFILGMLICWLLNLVQLGIAFLLLASSEKMLPAVYVMVGGMGLVQVGYVVPIHRLLQRHGKRRVAQGLLLAAFVTLMVNIALDYRFFGSHIFHFWR